MRLLAPAKINLHLRVGPPASDGFHPLLSWMCTVGLYDELTFARAAQNELECDDPSIPTGRQNLVIRAAAALGVTAKIKLTKRIPAGGGLAGGSSDAACTLAALNELYSLGRSRGQLAEAAAKLGSDVPFFLGRPSSICTGAGQHVHPTAAPLARWLILIFPPFAMATPGVYRRFDEMNLGDESRLKVQPDWQDWARLAAVELLPRLVNDLEIPAFDINPSLGALRDEHERRLGRPVRMSGSGSTLFTLYDSQADAVGAAETISPPAVVAELAPVMPPVRAGGD